MNSPFFFSILSGCNANMVEVITGSSNKGYILGMVEGKKRELNV
jgi:hypothetical protein